MEHPLLEKEEERELLIKLSQNHERYRPLERMVKGWYFCKARNFKYGYWNGDCFEYMREKWGNTYPAVEQHYDVGSPYGTVKPLKQLTTESDGR